jgi:ribokinase
MSTFDCITVGNAVIDAFLTLQDDNNAIKLNKPDRLLSVPYGQKILLSSCEFLLGGNACNVGVGLKRAGFHTSLVAELASDEFSEKIVNGLKSEKVDLSQVIRHTGQSSFSIGINYQGERTLFVEHQERHHPFFFNEIKTDLIYLTSLGHKWTHVYERVAHYIAKNHETILAFNPGSLQFKDGVGTFSFLFPLTTILFLNKEEAEKIVNTKADAKDLLPRLKDKGPGIVVITDGEKGSYSIDERGSILYREALKVPSVERTGAGDAYAAGFLAAFLEKRPITDCMNWGTHNAASVIGKVGAQSGLLTKEELSHKL